MPPPCFAYDNFLQKQDVDLGWIRHVMRNAALSGDAEEVTDAAWVDWVVDDWVGDGMQSGGQLGYYRDKAALKSAAYRRTELMGTVSLWAGIAIAAVLFAAAAGMAARLAQSAAGADGYPAADSGGSRGVFTQQGGQGTDQTVPVHGAGIQQRQAPVGYSR